MQRVVKQWEMSALGRKNLRSSEAGLPVPRVGEVLVKVGAVPLNYRDGNMIASGVGGALPWPFTPASDMVGTVVATCKGAALFRAGDRVFSTFEFRWTDGKPPGNGQIPFYEPLGGHHHGVLAKYLACPEGWFVTPPASLDAAAASTLICAGLTAWFALVELGRMLDGEAVLVHGTGGVALFDSQIEKLPGGEVTIVSDSAAKLDRAKALSIADHVIGRTVGDWVEAAYRTTFDPRGSPLGTSALMDFVHAADRRGLKPVIDERHPFAGLPATLAHVARGHSARSCSTLLRNILGLAASSSATTVVGNPREPPIAGETAARGAAHILDRVDGVLIAFRRLIVQTRTNTKSVILAAILAFVPTLAVSAEPLAPASGASDRVDAIRQRGALRVAVLDEYPWLKRMPAGGAPFEGPAWLLAETYARRLGVKLETTSVGFDDKVSVLSGDRADITIAPLLETPDRAATVDLITYSLAAHCLFGLANNPKIMRADSIGDLDRPDVTVGFIDGSPQGAWTQERLPKAARRGVAGTIADLATSEVVSHSADVAPIDQFFFAGLVKRTPGLVTIPRGRACLESMELPISIGMAVSKGQPAFTAWLRAEALAIEPQLKAEQARVVAEGP